MSLISTTGGLEFTGKVFFPDKYNTVLPSIFGFLSSSRCFKSPTHLLYRADSDSEIDSDLDADLSDEPALSDITEYDE